MSLLGDGCAGSGLVWQPPMENGNGQLQPVSMGCRKTPHQTYLTFLDVSRTNHPKYVGFSNTAITTAQGG
jgi:hypothetical protein